MNPRGLAIGGWTYQRYQRLTARPAFVIGLAGILLLLFRVKLIFVWALCLGLFVYLGLRAHRHRPREANLIAIGVFVGLPLGFSLALVKLGVEQRTADVLDLVRLPILLALVGTVITSATGYVRTRPVTTKHLLFGDLNPPKRKHA